MKLLKIGIIIVVLLLALYIRVHNYTVYPQRGATSDEYTYAFLGMSLLTKGVPISWSYFPYDNRREITIDKILFPIVQPYFDHPPLNGIATGGWVLLFGENTFQKIQLSTVRIFPIILSLFSSILIFLIGKKLYGYKTGLWGLLIFSSATMFVMNTRVAVAENLLTLLMLCAIYLYVVFEKKLTAKKAVVLGVVCGLAFLTKILGIFVFLSLLYLLFMDKAKRKYILFFITTFLIFIALLFGYGAYYDFNQFMTIQLAQGGRDIGFETLWLLFLQPTIVNKVYNDPWYFLGIFGLFYSLQNIKINKYITIPALIYLLLLLFTLTQHGHSGWYAIPLFPLMSILVADMLQTSLQKKSLLFLLFMILIGLFYFPSVYLSAFGLTGGQYRILFLLLLIPFFFAFLLKKDTVFRFLGNMWFYILIICTISLTINYVHPA